MNLNYERKKIAQGYEVVIGCDEVGRGSLAGPVVAAAVALSKNNKNLKAADIKDSKLLSVSRRQELSENIKNNALAWAVGLVDEKVIDKINIHHATLLAMKQSVENLLFSYSSELENNGKIFLVVDGKFAVPNLSIEQAAVVDGDNKILCVAAASIIAKVYRDELMRQMHNKYPVYNFRQHKGYGTLFHRTMILQNGLSPAHRKSFCRNLVR